MTASAGTPATWAIGRIYKLVRDPSDRFEAFANILQMARAGVQLVPDEVDLVAEYVEDLVDAYAIVKAAALPIDFEIGGMK